MIILQRFGPDEVELAALVSGQCDDGLLVLGLVVAGLVGVGEQVAERRRSEVAKHQFIYVVIFSVIVVIIKKFLLICMQTIHSK